MHTDVIFAQAPLIQATVDKTDLTTDEVLTLTVTIEGEGNISEPLLPTLDGIRIVSHRSRSVTVINSQSSSVLTHEYVLKPTTDGPLTIDPIQVRINGKTTQTNPITVEIHPGTSPASGIQDSTSSNKFLQGQDYFVESTVDNSSPFLGEQVTYTFRYYSSSPRGRFFFTSPPMYEWPTMTGFWSYDDSTLNNMGISTQQRSYDTVKYGKKYLVREVQHFLFPTIVGARIIESAKLTLPGGFSRKTMVLESSANTITTEPLPAGAPKSFNGAVGKFSINAFVDNQSPLYNQPVVLSLEIRGTGNVELLAKPEWPQNKEWRSVDDRVTTKFEIEDGKLIGTRTYRTSLLPLQTGVLTIPAIEFTYFDPVTREYQTIFSDSIPVSITRKSSQSGIGNTPATPDKQMERLATDIRHIKPGPAELDVFTDPIFKQPIYWLFISLPLPILFGTALFLVGKKVPIRKKNFGRKSAAYGEALKALALAEHQDPDIYAAIDAVVNDYISTRLQYPTAGLTHKELLNLLGQHGISPKLMKRLENCLYECDTNRFAPQKGQANSPTILLMEIDAVIEALETEFESNFAS